MNYSEFVKTLRHKMILSQIELEEELEVSFASVNRLETGKHDSTIKVKRKLIELCKENRIL